MTEAFRILIADDEPSMLNAYGSVLLSDSAASVDDDRLDELESELFGGRSRPVGQRYELVMCQQGEQAISAVKKAESEGRPFSVAFLDVRMPPGINGVETAREIRAIDPDLNIVFVTAYSDTDPRDISRMVPPVERLFYVAKPFQPQELQQFASALSHKWRVEQELLTAHALLKNQYVQVEAARGKAEKASRLKTEFLANISHELRTPLNSIIGFSEMIAGEPHGPIGSPKYQSYVHDIHTSGLHLLGVVNDILDISKLEVGEFELQIEEVDVAEAIDTAIRIVGERAQRAGVQINADVASTLPCMRGDARRVRQILLNLLSNSIKFTDAGGKVTVSANQTEDGGILLSVADTGIGIAPEDVDRAMAPFGQVDGKLNRMHDGTGLGLPLAKSLTELHGGDFRLESAVGRGTTVTLSFRAAA
ncbi:MAG: ATP-binding response regulator [Dongiaceae bacterium]